MKKAFLTLILITIYFLNSHAQTQAATSQATWVVESASPKAKAQTVKFYDDKMQLIYAETINKRLNVSKKKVQKALNQVLDGLLTQQGYANSKNVLAASFKLKP